MASKLRTVGIMRVTVVLVTYVLAFTGLDFIATQFEANGVLLWYPPAAANVVLLLVFGVRWAPALLATVVIHSSLVVRVGLDWVQVGALAIVTAASFGIAARILTRVLRVDPRLPTLRDVLWFGLTMCLAAPVPIAVMQAWLLNSAGSIDAREFIGSAAGFWAGSATGVGMLAPVVLVIARRWRHDEQFDPDLNAGTLAGSSRLETVGQAVALVAAVWIAFDGRGGSLDYSYLIYAPLIWIGLRGGFMRAAIAVLATNIGAVALQGGKVSADGGFALQFGLVSLTLIGVTLGAAVAQRKSAAARNLGASLRDPLTGIANRTLLNDRMAHLLSRRPLTSGTADNATSNGALLLLDLDRFKQINDGLGHAAGDAVLVEVAHRLVSAVRDVDTVARLGGDEFAVLLDGIDPGDIDETADRVLDSVTQPIVTTAGTVHLTTSVGSVLVAPTAASDRSAVTTIEQVLHHGDIALLRAKHRGRNRHVAFDGEMHEQAIILQTRESALRDAFGRNEISVVYQRIVDMSSSRVVGAEALARWNPPIGEAVSATDLVAAAERSSQITQLGHSVLRQACTAAVSWPDTSRLAVNVSVIELRQPGYVASVLKMLDETGLDNNRLELEITENHWIGEAHPATRALSEAGVRLVLDDFGTGYSSISHLHDMPLSGIKIDSRFVSTLHTDARSVKIVKALLYTAAELDLDVTAEGVELQAHWDFLLDHGCTRAQGYLLGRPEPGMPNFGMIDRELFAAT